MNVAVAVVSSWHSSVSVRGYGVFIFPLSVPPTRKADRKDWLWMPGPKLTKYPEK